MDAFPTIGKGLLIRLDGDVYQWLSKAGEHFNFEAIENGTIYVTTQLQFYEDYAAGKLEIVSGFVSDSEIKYDSESGESPGLCPPLSDLNEKWSNDLNRKCTYLAGLRREGVSRGQIGRIATVVARIAKETGDGKAPGASTVSKWMKSWQESGGFDATLVSMKSAPAKRGAVDLLCEDIADKALGEVYLKREGGSIRSAHRHYLRLVKQENRQREEQGCSPIKILSERTFFRRVENLDKYEVTVAREGYNAARKKFRMVMGPMEAERVLDYAEIDHSEVNLFVIDDKVHLPLGRPKITVIKERRTKIILGLYVSFAPSGLECISGALLHSLMDHKKAYDLWPELENPWPAFGRARTYTVDRGKDFTSAKFQTLIRDLKATPEWCERRTPWHKPSIERCFGTMEQSLFETMPGRTFRSIEARGDYNPVKQAVIRFSTFVFLLHKWVVDFHNIEPNSRTGESPLEAWIAQAEAIPPQLPMDPAEQRIAIGSHPFEARISHEGIRCDNLHYASEELAVILRRYGPGATMRCRLPFNDIGSIFVLDPEARRYVEVPCTQRSYAEGLTRYQHRYISTLAREKRKEKAPINVLLHFKEVLREKIGDVLVAKDTRTKSRLARAANISSAGTLDRRPNSILAPFPVEQTALAMTNSLSDVLPELEWGV